MWSEMPTDHMQTHPQNFSHQQRLKTQQQPPDYTPSHQTLQSHPPMSFLCFLPLNTQATYCHQRHSPHRSCARILRRFPLPFPLQSSLDFHLAARSISPKQAILHLEDNSLTCTKLSNSSILVNDRFLPLPVICPESDCQGNCPMVRDHAHSPQLRPAKSPNASLRGQTSKVQAFTTLTQHRSLLIDSPDPLFQKKSTES